MTPTRALMTSSAIFLAGVGLPGTFAPDALLRVFGAAVSEPSMLLTQMLGALFLGFAAVNWMARGSLMGGIYNRPLAIGNLMHFIVAGLALIKALTHEPAMGLLWPLTILYAGFAAAFGVVLFRHPIPAQSASNPQAPIA